MGQPSKKCSLNRLDENFFSYRRCKKWFYNFIEIELCIFQGLSFGAEVNSVSGECVFQTGMVGYPESLTDPSYRGQILVLTFPLIGNYGVPSRDVVDDFSLKKYFESNEIHITGLIIGQYSQEFSHYLAKSSSSWFKENNIPALYGIDTRAFTEKI